MRTTKPGRHCHGAGKFGSLLSHWRHARRQSQLELAGLAGVSARHVSFLESGLAQPSRDMIEKLGQALDLPLETRNTLHLAAGFAPPHVSSDGAVLDDPHVRQALEWMLGQQEPYPAIVIDGRWDIRFRNAGASRMFAPFRSSYDMPQAIAGNAMHSVFHPRGLRPFIVNWQAFAAEMIQMLHREVAQGSEISAGLLKEIEAYPDLPRSWTPHSSGRPSSPLMTMQLRKDDLRMSFFSTFTTFAMPADAGLQQLKIECFFPADDQTRALAIELAEQ